MTSPESQPISHSWWLKGLIVVLLISLAICGLGLFVRIVFWNPSIGIVQNETEALTNANERLLEMIKWTISTILLIGGGLIGLNWYQNEKRIEAVMAQQWEQLSRSEQLTRLTLDQFLSQLNHSFDQTHDVTKSHIGLKFSFEIYVLREYGYGRDKAIVDAVYSLVLDNATLPQFCLPFIDLLLETLDDESLTGNYRKFQLGNHHQELVDLLRKVGLEDHASRLATLATNLESQ